MKRTRDVLFAFCVLLTNQTFSQNSNSIHSIEYDKGWFFSMGGGLQISGIKSEDFIRTNVSPAFVVNTGKWLIPEVALQIGYQGFYFHTISDNSKHYYNFFYGEALFNIHELLNSEKISTARWNIVLHPGAGYFYNCFYNRPNICANLGVINNYRMLNQLELFVDISAIMGWDIYQENEDILPSIVWGLNYFF